MEQSLQAMSRQVRLEQWSGKFAACRGSGMTVRAWCHENSISGKTYYYTHVTTGAQFKAAQTMGNILSRAV